MPKGLSALLELRVFKGFVISNSQSRSSVGSIDDLKELTKLRKLTIKSSSKCWALWSLVSFDPV